tara:strand:- start:29164 stop:29265 length:102 start_codon:yes stop_codon:yes gene_type:complete
MSIFEISSNLLKKAGTLFESIKAASYEKVSDVY